MISFFIRGDIDTDTLRNNSMGSQLEGTYLQAEERPLEKTEAVDVSTEVLLKPPVRDASSGRP